MTGRLLVISPNDPRRKETYVGTQITALERTGWDVVSAYHLARGGDTKVDDRFIAVPVETSRAPRTILGRLSKIASTCIRKNSEQAGADELQRWHKTIRDVAPDCILVQFGPVAARMLPVLIRCGIPLAIQFHGYDLTLLCRHWGYRQTLASLLRAAGAAFVPSAFLEGELRRFIRDKDRKKVFRISPGYNESVFVPLHRLSEKEGQFRLVSVGRLVAVKGHDIVIRAVAHAGESFYLTIVGDGEERERLQLLINKFGVRDRVQLLGPKSPLEIRSSFAKADCFIQMSTATSQGQREGLGLSPIEAAATGLPVIVSDSGGLAETCIHSVTGVVVADHDVQAATDAIARMAAERNKARTMGTAGAEWVSSTFASRRQAALADAVLRHL